MVNCCPQWLVPGQTGDNQELAQAFEDHRNGRELRYHDYKKDPEYFLPEYCAILRIHAVDVELIPPADVMPRTLCKYLALSPSFQWIWLVYLTHFLCPSCVISTAETQFNWTKSESVSARSDFEYSVCYDSIQIYWHGPFLDTLTNVTYRQTNRETAAARWVEAVADALRTALFQCFDT